MTTTVRCALLLLVLASPALVAQTRESSPPDTDLCLGFSFGTWKPVLDLAAAGHRTDLDTLRYGKAPGGRDWAMNGIKGDTTLILFPMWWPAGVVVTLEHMPRSTSDTVRGRAVALVADARKDAPTTTIRAWNKPCHG